LPPKEFKKILGATLPVKLDDFPVSEVVAPLLRLNMR